MSKTPLPDLHSLPIKEFAWTPESQHYNAYITLLETEAHVVGLVAAARKAKLGRARLKELEGKLTAVRVAGHLFLECEAQSDPALFGVTPSAALVQWFISPPASAQDDQHDVIIACGECLRDNFIRVFRMSDTPYKQPSHPSPASFDTLADMIQDSTEPTWHGFSSHRKRVLARDGFRCVVTGVCDELSFSSCAELDGVGDVITATIETAHIFNQSTMQDIDHSVHRDDPDFRLYNRTFHATTALAIMKSFGFTKFVDAFTTEGGVHEAWNLLALEHNVHSFFDRLNMWFESTDTPHRYRVCTPNDKRMENIRHFSRDHRGSNAPIFVEFNSQYPHVPPPDAVLLALHATCARVAHMSGAAEFFDEIERDVEETRVLASDGSSALLLDHLLTPFAPIRGVA